MKFNPTPIDGCFTIDLEFREDQRGCFARVFCVDEFGAAGLLTEWAQMNMSRSLQRGTVRGLHFQRAPNKEVKVVRCTKGTVFDVAVDLREGSATFGKWFGIELNDASGQMLYVPEGCAHGFQALTDGAEVAYMCSARYSPSDEGGVFAGDPKIAVAWPLPLQNLSPRDEAMPHIDDVYPIS